jgi:hypothetical protein
MNLLEILRALYQSYAGESRNLRRSEQQFRTEIQQLLEERHRFRQQIQLLNKQGSEHGARIELLQTQFAEQRNRLELHASALRQEQQRLGEQIRTLNDDAAKPYDKIALWVAITASVFTAWQGIEAHLSRTQQARAYVGLQSVSADKKIITFQIKNTGNSPALHVAVDAGCATVVGANIPRDIKLDHHFQKDGMMLPNVDTSFWCGPDVDDASEAPEIIGKDDKATSQRRDDDRSRKKPDSGEISFGFRPAQSTRLVGTVKYRDVFNKEHFTNFCVQQIGEGPLVSPCENGNQAN